MRDIPFHPIADEYPLMPAKELGRLQEGMTKWGYDPKFPIVLYKKQILDGRNRYLAAKEAKVKPLFTSFTGTEQQARDFAQRANEERRHLAAEWLSKRREERIAQVAEMKAAGVPSRQIAAAVGVSQTQVQLDLAAATEQGCSVQPPGGVVNSADGRQRPANKPKILCERCSRVGEVKNCGMCQEARKSHSRAAAGTSNGAANGTARNGRAETNGHAEAPKDHAGNVLPKHLRPAFLDPWLQKTYDFLLVTSENFRGERIPDGMRKRSKHYPYFMASDVVDGSAFVIQYLDDLIAHFRENTPFAVCPSCNGDRCADCRMAGLVPEKVYKALQERAAK